MTDGILSKADFEKYSLRSSNTGSKKGKIKEAFDIVESAAKGKTTYKPFADKQDKASWLSYLYKARESLGLKDKVDISATEKVSSDCPFFALGQIGPMEA